MWVCLMLQEGAPLKNKEIFSANLGPATLPRLVLEAPGCFALSQQHRHAGVPTKQLLTAPRDWGQVGGTPGPTFSSKILYEEKSS